MMHRMCENVWINILNFLYTGSECVADLLSWSRNQWAASRQTCSRSLSFAQGSGSDSSIFPRSRALSQLASEVHVTSSSAVLQWAVPLVLSQSSLLQISRTGLLFPRLITLWLLGGTLWSAIERARGRLLPGRTQSILLPTLPACCQPVQSLFLPSHCLSRKLPG